MKKEDVYISIKKEELDRILQTLEQSLHQIGFLKDRIRELEHQQSKTSKNSSKPPSSDGFKKGVKNNRFKSGKKQGGQKGHLGTTLKMVGVPDVIIKHQVQGKCECGEDLTKLPTQATHKRQVFELPPKLLEVTEHQVEVKECLCGKIHKAFCEYDHYIQYGNKLKSFGVYLSQYHFLPYNRLQEFMKDIVGVSIGGGTLEKSNVDCFENLAQVELGIKEILKKSSVLHNDETGVRSEIKGKWAHSSSTKTHTHYAIHDKRGKEAMDDIGILSEFDGISVHDRWASYEKYDFDHAYCNAHILRDLKFLHEDLKEAWAGHMIKLLVKANIAKKENKLNPEKIMAIKSDYEIIIDQAIKSEKKKEEGKKLIPKRGRPPTSKSLRMINMFLTKHKEVLKFIDYPEVPFDNNLAERDLRMVKLKQKISGCFRSGQGADTFFRIRSYISTARKQGHNVFDAIEKALSGNPLDILIAEQ